MSCLKKLGPAGSSEIPLSSSDTRPILPKTNRNQVARYLQVYLLFTSLALAAYICPSIPVLAAVWLWDDQPYLSPTSYVCTEPEPDHQSV